MTNALTIVTTETTVEAEAPATHTKPKFAIPNVAALTDDALRAAIKKSGKATPQRLGKAKDRKALIKLARDLALWDYRGDVVPAAQKAKYGKAQTCGDSVAELLRQTDFDWLTAVANANDIRIDRWAHCNYGQTVMNLGNVLRGKIRRGEYVVIGTTEWNIENA